MKNHQLNDPFNDQAILRKKYKTKNPGQSLGFRTLNNPFLKSENILQISIPIIPFPPSFIHNLQGCRYAV